MAAKLKIMVSITIPIKGIKMCCLLMLPITAIQLRKGCDKRKEYDIFLIFKNGIFFNYSYIMCTQVIWGRIFL